MSGSLPFTTVTNETQLNADIEAADTLTNAGTYVINFGNAIAEGTLPGVTIAANGATAVVAPDLTAVDLHSGVTLVINGNGDVLNGENAYRGLFVYGGDVIVNDLTIANAVATGGAGATDSGGGGGGGAGLGGGLFIGATGTATLNQVYFSDDKATGGAGGGAKGKYGIYGGGGGLGGPGGGYYGYNTATGGGAGGGGGIGRTAAGGVLGNNHNFKASPGIVGSGANNPGSGGTGYNGTPSDDFPTTSPGGSFGGGGGYGYEYNNPDGESSGNRPGGAGGGGIGGSNGKNGATGSGYGKGGKGGFGGGGGGGYSIGGQGGFGGGGGVGYSTSGAGGWGGGGGGGVFKGTAGAGGFGGGAGAAGKYVAYGSPSDYGGGGGGGLGAGGDVFVYKGGSLIIGSGTLAGGSVAGGAGGVSSHSAAHNGGTGSAFGSGIFLYGNGQAATFTPALGKSVTVDDQIYDQKGAGNGSNTGLVILDGAGELILAATNSFWGGTTLEGGGTLELNASGAGGSGGITFGSGSNRLLINSSELPNGGSLVNTINGFAFGDVIELAGLGYATGATSLTVSGSIVKVTSNSQTDTLTVASPPSLVVVKDSSGAADVIDSTFTITSAADLTNDLGSVNVGGAYAAFSDASFVFDFINNFAITSAQTVDLTSGDTVTFTGGNAASGGGYDIVNGTLAAGDAGAFGNGTINFSSPTGALRIDTATAPANTITRFVQGDEIDLNGIAYASGDTPQYNAATGELDIKTSGGGTVASLFFGQNNGLQTASFSVAQETSGTGIVVTDNVPCFLRGTRIRTPAGEVLVETLRVGDHVVTLSGAAMPIVWIGTGRMLVTRGQRCAATPIVVRKGALADNVPYHDLRVTKGHSLFLDGILIPAEYLVNHRSIAWDDHAREVDYYHIETEQHDVLVSNGAAAETYRDDGNRWLFQNANSGWDQPPKPPCAPVLTGGPLVDAIWRRLLDRAGPRPGIPLTDDPGLYLLADGERYDGVRHGCWHAFLLPHPPASLRIVSRAASPAELGLVRDPRMLGVALRQIRIGQGARLRVLQADDASLHDGFHAFEPECGHRWTDGDGAIPAPFLDGLAGPCEVLLELTGATHYVDEGVRQAA